MAASSGAQDEARVSEGVRPFPPHDRFLAISWTEKPGVLGRPLKGRARRWRVRELRSWRCVRIRFFSSAVAADLVSEDVVVDHLLPWLGLTDRTLRVKLTWLTPPRLLSKSHTRQFPLRWT